MLHDLTKQYKWIKTHIYYYKISHVCKYRNTSSYQNNILIHRLQISLQSLCNFSLKISVKARIGQHHRCNYWIHR